MGKIGKGLVLFLILLIAIPNLTVLIIKSVSAQGNNNNNIPEASVPQFTAKVVDISDIPDSYWFASGEVGGSKMNVPSDYQVHYVIELTIKNQPFSSYIFKDTSARALDGDYIDRNVSMFYNIRMKDPSWENWTVFYDAGLGFPYASKSDYTVMLIPIGNVPVGGGNNTIVPLILRYYWDGNGFAATESAPYGGQLDFQVESMIGYVSRTIEFNSWHFTGQLSDWSETQSITMPSSPESPSPSPTVPEFSFWTLPLLLSIMVAAAGLLVYHKKHKQNSV